MQVVYIDTLFCLNFAVNYLLLLGTGHFSGYPYSRWRLILSALLGAVYAVLVSFPELGFLESAVGKVVSGVAMVYIGFGYSGFRSFCKHILLFLLVSVVFGGGVLAIYIASGGEIVNFRSGVLYTRISLKVLIISIALCYGVVSLFFRGVGRHGGFRKEVVRVKVRHHGKEVRFSALIDSGNTLIDPVTGSNVLIAEPEAVKAVLPSEVRGLFDRKSLRAPSDLMEILAKLGFSVRFRLIPYRAVGTETGLLIAFRPDEIEIDDKRKTGMLIALSPNELSEGAGYCALVGAYL